MTKRHRQSVKASKRKRQEARHPSRRTYVPYVIVVVVAGALIAALFVVSLGGSGTENVEAAYPPGYSAPVQGDPDAPVELVMWGDFQCPFCKRFETETLPRIRSEYVDTGQVKLVWRNFEHYGRESQDAAVAAHCAGEQGEFWEFHDTLYRVQGGVHSGAFSPSRLLQLAQDHELDIPAFEACQTQFKYDAVLAADYGLGRSQGVTGTPGFFVNGQYISGAQPFEVFAGIIDSEIIAAGP